MPGAASLEEMKVVKMGERRLVDRVLGREETLDGQGVEEDVFRWSVTLVRSLCLSDPIIAEEHWSCTIPPDCCSYFQGSQGHCCAVVDHFLHQERVRIGWDQVSCLTQSGHVGSPYGT